MATRDCPNGASRWVFAVRALLSTLVDMANRVPNQHAMLFTCGTTVVPIAGEPLYEAIDISNSDASACIGQAALEAAWHAGEGHVVIIADGPSAQDSHVGELVLGNDVAMGALFSRTYFLTVGKADAELAAFAGKWPHSDSLESVLAEAQEFADTQSRTDAETAPTEPPPAPDLQADGSVLLVKSSKAPKRR
jgi:hypothetical protein